jgi:ADP-ribosyl-[dinitrogen reductase] hydrolase
LGLACGDALGAPIEFMRRDNFHPVTDFRGGGAFGVRPGQWTDDTAMALCLADSLIACRGFDAADQMKRYLRWYREGYLSSSGSCIDIGSTTRESLELFSRTGNPYAGPTTAGTAGNGCLMRLAPVPMFYVRDPREACEKGALSARTTHGAPECLDACRYFAWLLVRALNGEPKEKLLAPVPWLGDPLCAKVAEVAAGSYWRKDEPQIQGSGYVVESLEAALWAFGGGSNFAECVRLAANLGDDTDTTAAICGQLAGAHYGEAGIPSRWLSELHWTREIRSMADQLLVLSGVDTAYVA